jgi:hypothetical protein
VIYDGAPGDVAVAAWHEWNIDLGIFAAAGVALTNVDRIHIGFGGPPVGQKGTAGAGTVYFDDITIVSGPDVVDDFDSYADYSALLTVWDDYWVNATGAEIFLETDPNYIRGGNSIQYHYDNSYFLGGTWVGSVIDADIADLTIGANWRPRDDLGWYLNTNDRGLGGNPGAPGHRGTKLQDIMNGAAGNGGLIGAGTGYFPSAGLINFIPTNYGAHRMYPPIYAAFDTTGHAQHLHTDPVAYWLIESEIDGNNGPLLAHFDHFNLLGRTRASDANLGGDFDWATWGSAPIYGPNGYTDDETGEVWDPCGQGLGHTVTVVGYWLAIDASNPTGADAIIVYDNADGTLPGPAPLPLVLPWPGSPWMGLTFIDPGIMPPVVTVPNGGEAWVADSNYNITWANAGTIADVVVDYSTNNGSSWASVSPANVGNKGSYDWVIPLVDSNECLVRVSSVVHSNLSDTSNDVFTIYQCPLYYDLTGDCFVNLLDLDALGSEWLECGNPFDANCLP